MIIQTDFGYNQVHIGRITVYTGKIRVKGEHVSHNPLIIAEFKAGYTTFLFETINKEVYEDFKRKISLYCKHLAQTKLDNKYSWCSK